MPHTSRVPKHVNFTPQSPRLMGQVKEVMRYFHYSLRSEDAYCRWIKAFICFHNTRHPNTMGKLEVERFLTHLAVNKNVAISTQNQALNALVFLYDKVLKQPLGDGISAVRSKKAVQLPVVLSRAEVVTLLSHICDPHLLMAQLMYGGGLRLMEVMRLRVQDIDYANGLLLIRDGKGGKHRRTLLPESVHATLKKHLLKVEGIFQQDLAAGVANVYLPHALTLKYPAANKDWRWQYVFPAKSISVDPRGGEKRRHHIDKSGLQKAIHQSAKKAAFTKRITTHTLRHSFATHLLEAGTNIRVVQKLMGHEDVKTTEIYTHVLQENLTAVVSPLDCLN